MRGVALMTKRRLKVKRMATVKKTNDISGDNESEKDIVLAELLHERETGSKRESTSSNGWECYHPHRLGGGGYSRKFRIGVCREGF